MSGSTTRKNEKRKWTRGIIICFRLGFLKKCPFPSLQSGQNKGLTRVNNLIMEVNSRPSLPILLHMELKLGALIPRHLNRMGEINTR